jgi:hypothetical protein
VNTDDHQREARRRGATNPQEEDVNGPTSHPAIPALLVAIGLTAGGWFAGNGFVRARMADRFVTVKGVSERDVRADLALWPIRVRATGNDLARAQNDLAASITKVRAFLARNGVDTSTSHLGGLDVADAYSGMRGKDLVGMRYTLGQTLLVRSDKPEVILLASQRVGDLLRQGVLLGSTSYEEEGPAYLFTKLNDIKPAMIAEATARAHEAAEQFARDSRSSVGGIRQANQGQFEILGRDAADANGEIAREWTQLDKRVRVVSTVDWYLKD